MLCVFFCCFLFLFFGGTVGNYSGCGCESKLWLEDIPCLWCKQCSWVLRPVLSHWPFSCLLVCLSHILQVFTHDHQIVAALSKCESVTFDWQRGKIALLLCIPLAAASPQDLHAPAKIGSLMWACRSVSSIQLSPYFPKIPPDLSSSGWFFLLLVWGTGRMSWAWETAYLIGPRSFTSPPLFFIQFWGSSDFPGFL